MQREIKSLAKKKKWTGRDVGLAYLAWLSCDVKERREEQRKLPFTIKDIVDHRKELTSEERSDFFFYEKIGLGLGNCRTYVMKFRQQFFAGFYRYFYALREARRAEEFFSTLENIPVIMTRDEYEQKKENFFQKKENFFGLTDGLKMSVANIVCDIAAGFAWEIAEGREKDVPQAIKNAIKTEGKELVKNKRVLYNYVDQVEYFLPDGTGTKDSSLAAWQEALARAYCEKHGMEYDRKKADEARLKEYYRMLFAGKPAIENKIGRKLTKKEAAFAVEVLERIIAEAEGTAREIRRNQQEAALRALLYIEADVQPATNNDPPDNLTKWELLKDRSLAMYRGFYSARRAEPYGDLFEEITREEQYKEFMQDFPKTYKAAYDYLLQIVPEAAKVKDTIKPFISMRELVERGYKRLWSNTGDVLLIGDFPAPPKTTEEKNLVERAARHGIAILQNASLPFVDPAAESEKKLAGINHLMSNKDEYEELQGALYALMLPALSFVVTHNEYIKVFAKIYKLKFLENFCIDTEYLKECLQEANEELFLLYRRAYGTEAEKKKKREFLRASFRSAAFGEVTPDIIDIRQFKTQLQERTEEGGEYALSLIQFVEESRQVVKGIDGEKY